MGRKIHAGRRSRRDMGAEASERIDKRMYRSAALQVAGYRHVEVLEVLVLLFQGEQIAERLRRMLMTAVTAVDNRNG